MTIKDKLNLMDEIKTTNESRVKAFLQESKTVKHWKADYQPCPSARDFRPEEDARSSWVDPW